MEKEIISLILLIVLAVVWFKTPNLFQISWMRSQIGVWLFAIIGFLIVIWGVCSIEQYATDTVSQTVVAVDSIEEGIDDEYVSVFYFADNGELEQIEVHESRIIQGYIPNQDELVVAVRKKQIDVCFLRAWCYKIGETELVEPPQLLLSAEYPSFSEELFEIEN